VGSGLFGANSDVIAVHPSNADVVLIATYDGFEFPLDTRAAVGVFKSTDGGNTFTRSDTGITSLVRSFAFHPINPNIVLAGSNGGGVFRSIDGGATWTPSNAGLAARYIARGFAFGPSNPNVVYVATWDDGVYVSEDAGLSWSPLWNGLLNVNVSSVATVPGTSAGTYELVAGTSGGLFTLAQAAAATSGAAVSVPSQAGGGATIGLAVSGVAGATLLGVEGVAIDDPSLNQKGRPSGYAFADGALKYRVVGIVNGATVTVSITYPAALPVGSKVFKISSSGFTDFPGAVIGGNTVTLVLTDGGAGDADGQANGVIVDPVAVGVPARGTGSGGGCSTGGGAEQTVLALGAAWYWLRRRRPRVDI
jgi:uncharacterized protein (TIGR03382 family)